LGLLSRWGEGAAFNTWGVFAISYATGTLHLARVPVLIAVTVAALLMAVLLPVSGLLADRFGPRPVYASGIAAYGLAVFPVFALFQHAQHHRVCARNVVGVRGYSRLVLWRAGNTLRFAVPARIRYTGLSTVYQLSGVYASGLTPLILTALVAAANRSPWLACTYLVATAVISVVATLLLRPRPLPEI
jgi:MFS family permease